jgi:DNA-binding transcriptional MerR regulator
MGFFIQEYQDFRGSVNELSALAIRCSNFLDLPGDTDKINERTIRYYVTEGLVDRPTRIGRDAEYEYIHLLQFLVSRYLVNAGYPMAKVAPYMASKSVEELEKFLGKPTKPNLAELLVASFATDQPYRSQRRSINPTLSQNVSPRMEKVQSQTDFKEIPGFLRKDSNRPNKESLKSSRNPTSSRMNDLFAQEEVQTEKSFKQDLQEIKDSFRKELNDLNHRLHSFHEETQHYLTKVIDQIEEQESRYQKRVEQLHQSLEKLHIEIEQSNQEWRKEFEELHKLIEHQSLPPIEAERASQDTPPSPLNK